MNWYKQSQITIKPPYDGSGHMTGDDPALIFEAQYDDQDAGYALVVMPQNKNYTYIGQVTVRPEYRLKGVATALYQNIDAYLSTNGLPSLHPSRDLTPGSRKIWDKRLSGPRLSQVMINWYKRSQKDQKSWKEKKVHDLWHASPDRIYHFRPVSKKFGHSGVFFSPSYKSLLDDWIPWIRGKKHKKHHDRGTITDKSYSYQGLYIHHIVVDPNIYEQILERWHQMSRKYYREEDFGFWAWGDQVFIEEDLLSALKVVDVKYMNADELQEEGRRYNSRPPRENYSDWEASHYQSKEQFDRYKERAVLERNRDQAGEILKQRKQEQKAQEKMEGSGISQPKPIDSMRAVQRLLSLQRK